MSDDTAPDEAAHAGRSACALCARPITDDGWIGLEITRDGVLTTGELGDPESLSAVFCSQEHAVSYLARPLPALRPQQPPPPRSPAREALELIVIIAGGVLTVALMVIGLWTAIQWVVG